MRVEETTKVATIDEPKREKMLVTTDENIIMGGLKRSLFGLELYNTITKSTRLQMSVFTYLRPNFLFRRWTILRLSRGPSQAKQMVPRRMLPHPDTSYSLISPSTRQLAGHIRTRRIPF